MPDVERVVPPVAELAESPVWDPATTSLLWVDIPAGAVHRYRPESGDETVLVAGEPVGAVGVRVGGGLVLAAGLGVELVDLDGSRRVLAKVDVGDRMNDAKCDPFGRFIAGTLRADETPGGAGLYAIESDGTVRVLRSDVTLSNGLGWTADCRTMFHIDTTDEVVYAYDYELDTGTLGKRRVFADLRDELGRPDGLAVDTGGVWVAVAGGGRVQRYLLDGTLDRVVRLPVRKVTSCAFGGADLRDLYITTSRVGLSPEELAAEPDAGALFRCRPGTVGALSYSFAG